MSPKERSLAWVAAFAVVMCAVGVTPLALARAASVRALLVASHPRDALEIGSSRGSTLAVRAEAARAFVDPLALPGAGGRPSDAALAGYGFARTETTHLRDVRGVFGLSVWLSLGGALLAAAMLAAAGAGRRAIVARASAKRAALTGAVLTGVALAIGVLAFGPLFNTFHAVFFEAGTWVFPEESALIQTFPERFWALAAASWAVGSLGLLAAWWVAATAVVDYLLPASGGNRSAAL